MAELAAARLPVSLSLEGSLCWLARLSYLEASAARQPWHEELTWQSSGRAGRWCALKFRDLGTWSHHWPGTSPEPRAAGGEGDSGVLASSSTQDCLMECGNSLHPSSSLSGFRASLEMSWPWLEAEQSPEPSMLPGTSGNLPPSAFFSLAGTTPTCASRARLDGTDKQEGWMWIRVVYSLSNSLKNRNPKHFW